MGARRYQRRYRGRRKRKGYAENQLNYPSAVLVDGQGYITISDTENYRIQRWYPGASTGGTIAGSIKLRSIAFDNAGNLFAVENNTERRAILKFTIGNPTPEVVLNDITGFGFSPSDIFLDADNNLFIADYYKRRVVRVAPGTTAQVVVAGGFDQFSQALNRIDQPTGIYVDAQGAMFVADNGNNRVVKWLP